MPVCLRDRVQRSLYVVCCTTFCAVSMLLQFVQRRPTHVVAVQHLEHMSMPASMQLAVLELVNQASLAGSTDMMCHLIRTSVGKSSTVLAVCSFSLM